MENQEQEELKNQIMKKYGLLLDKSEICELLKISSSSLSRAMANAEIEYIKSQKSNSAVKFTAGAVTNYVYSNTIKCIGNL